MNSYLRLGWIFWQLCSELLPKLSKNILHKKRGKRLLHPSVLQSVHAESVKITVTNMVE